MLQTVTYGTCLDERVDFLALADNIRPIPVNFVKFFGSDHAVERFRWRTS